MLLTRRASVSRVVWPFAGFALGLFRARDAAAVDRWPLCLFAEPECALYLGRHVLAEQGESVLATAEDILACWDRVRPVLAASWRVRDEKTLKSALPSILNQDFAASRTLIVEGWVLAKSEAELFAMAALHEQAGHDRRPALT